MQKTFSLIDFLNRPLGGEKTGKEKFKISGFQKKSIQKEKEYFLDNLSMLIESGMGIAPSLEVLEREIPSKILKKIIQQTQKKILEGYTLAQSLSQTNLLTHHMITLIEMGESTGRLSENLKVLVQQEQKTRIFRQKIKSAMIYPVFLLTFTLIVGILMAWVILPRLAKVFAQLQMELPLLSKGFIRIGMFLSQWGWLVIPLGFLGLWGGLYFLFWAPKTRHIGQNILFHIPTIKQLMTHVELALFGFVVGTLIKSGVGIVESLNAMKSSTLLWKYKEIYASLSDSIEKGEGFKKGLEKIKNHEKYIPPHIQEMIVSAEKSGGLALTFQKIGAHYEEKVDTSTKNLTSLLEPVLLLVIWFGVMGVAIAVILPIYSLIGNLNDVPVQTSPVSRKTEFGSALTSSSIEIHNTEITSQPYVVLKPGLNHLPVRSLPSSYAQSVGILSEKKGYAHQKTEKDWYFIKIDHNTQGWIPQKYVQLVEP